MSSIYGRFKGIAIKSSELMVRSCPTGTQLSLKSSEDKPEIGNNRGNGGTLTVIKSLEFIIIRNKADKTVLIICKPIY